MVIIRPAQEGDAAGIARVHVESWLSTYRGIIPDTFLDTLSVEKRTPQWQQTLAHLLPDEIVLVCEEEDRILGFISCGPSQNPIEGYDGEVLALYLMQPAQGRGLGRQLFEQGLERMSVAGRRAGMLWVLADNPTRGFYQHMGGKEIGKRTIQISGKKLSEVAYGWDLVKPI